MAGGANDRRGIAQRIRDARQAYKGPFTAAHIEKVVSEAGYHSIYDGDDDAFRVFRKDGCRPIPVNPGWEAVWDDDPIFRCLQRDLRVNRRRLLALLNQARSFVG